MASPSPPNVAGSVMYVSTDGYRWYSRTARPALSTLSSTGRFLISVGSANSPSIRTLLSGWINSAVDRKSVPGPTKRSDATYPKKMDMIARIT